MLHVMCKRYVRQTNPMRRSITDDGIRDRRKTVETTKTGKDKLWCDTRGREARKVAARRVVKETKTERQLMIMSERKRVPIAMQH